MPEWEAAQVMPTRITFVTGRGFDVVEEIGDVQSRLSASESSLVRFDISRGGDKATVYVNPFQIVYLEQA
jgi:hypothetical protein